MFPKTLLIAAALFLPAHCMAGGPAVAEAAGDEALFFYCAGLDAIFADEKDRAILGALNLLEQRLTELPAELGGPPGVDRAIGTAWDLFTSPLTLQVWSAPNPNGPPVSVQLTAMPSGQGAAARLEQALGDSIAMAGMRLTRQGGLQSAATPAGTLALGTLTRGGQGAVFIGLNSTGDHPEPDLNFNLPGDAKPVIAFRVDFKSMQPFMDAMLQEMGPESEQVRASIERMGGYGPDALRIEGAAGFTADQSVGVLRYRGLRKFTTDPDAAAFGKAQFRVVPQDAIWLSITTFDHSAFDLGEMGELGEQQDPFEALAPIIGANLRTELLDHLGRRVTAYRADSTGGGGLLSTIVILDLADPAAIAETHGRLVARFNQFAAQQARGYVRIRSWKQGDLDMFTLMTPGLPIPLEVTWSIVGSQLVLAGGPGAFLAAVDQIKGGKSSILDNKTFAQAAGSKLEGLASVHFLDTARLAPDGYGFLTMAAAALGNAVRSPTDPDRQPGLLLPPFGALFKNARPAISIGRWVGDDLVVESRGDRSMLVNAAASAGTAGGLPLVLVAGGIGLSAVGQAFEQSRAFEGGGMGELNDAEAFMAEEEMLLTMAEIEVDRIGVMVAAYAADHEDRLPRSMEDLNLDPDLLDSPFGPAPDGGADYALRADLPERLAGVLSPATTVLIVDRAAWQTAASRVAVGFVDGHVEMLQLADVVEAFGRPENAGASESMNLD